MRITALGCGHWLRRDDDGDIPDDARCAECEEPVHALVTWPTDDAGNIIHWWQNR